MNIKKSPIWKQAVQDFHDLGFKPGDTLTREWLMAHFELDEPTTIEEYRRFELRFLSHFEAFRQSLLEDHCTDLRNIWGTGSYLVTPPAEQTRAAMEDCHSSLSRALHKAGKRVRYINHDALNDAQRSANADAIAKLANLKAQTQPKKWLGMKEQK